MSTYICTYCRRPNDHIGVCDGCGANLPHEDYSVASIPKEFRTNYFGPTQATSMKEFAWYDPRVRKAAESE